MTPIFESSKVGERPATRVRITNPLTRWFGYTGVVVKTYPISGTHFIRLGEHVIPFARGEFEVITPNAPQVSI